MKKLLPNLVLLVLGLCVGLVVVEVASRLIYTRPWYEQLVEQQVLNNDWSAGIKLNQFGLRDRDYASPKPANTRRVLILGDSFTFGSGIADDQAVFPRLLEKQLNADPANRGTTIEILNGGIPGSLTSDWSDLLQKVKTSFQPDVILIVFFLRDGTRTDSMGSFFGPIRDQVVAENARSFWYQNLYLYRFYKDYQDRMYISQNYTEAINQSYVGTSDQTVEWRTAQFKIREIAAIGEEIHAKVGLVVFPVLAELDASYPFKPSMDTLVKFGADNGIPTTSLLPAFMGKNASDLWVSAYNQHPNAQGHQIAANGILPFLKQLLSESSE